MEYIIEIVEIVTLIALVVLYSDLSRKIKSTRTAIEKIGKIIGYSEISYYDYTNDALVLRNYTEIANSFKPSEADRDIKLILDHLNLVRVVEPKRTKLQEKRDLGMMPFQTAGFGIAIRDSGGECPIHGKSCSSPATPGTTNKRRVTNRKK